jgi:hypothetical protein
VLAAPLALSDLPAAGYGSGYLWLPTEWTATSALTNPPS